MSTSNLPVSVVVCAYTDRRWPEIQHAVHGLTTQTVAPREILLVVDHNPALADRAEAAFDGVTVLRNTRRRGLSGARNTGIAAATGDIVAFLDDDATPHPDWLATLLAPYADPAVLAVGGAAYPSWPTGSGRPGWLPAAPGATTGELDWVVGCTYTGLPVHRAEVRNLMGCAMSFRRAVFDEIGGFVEDLGRIGTVPLGCEETELCIRLRRYRPEARIVFEPAAVVRHHVDAARVRPGYLLRRCWAEGVSKAAVARIAGAADALSTEQRYLRQVLPAALARQLRATTDARRGGPTGAAAIVGAVVCTGAGYLRGRLAASGATPLPRQAVDVRPEAAPASVGLRPLVSVVVPTVDRPEALARCVKSLLDSEYDRLEIVVVDNRPRPERARQWLDFCGMDARIRYVAEPRPGVSHARNTGLAEARGAYVAFVDDDIEVDPHWLSTVVGELADPVVDCATSLVRPARLDTPAQRAFEAVRGFGQGDRRQVFGPELFARQPDHLFTPGRFGPGGCALWRASALHRLGGFDPLLGPGTPTRAGEDLHLFLRLARSGGTVVYAPDAVAYHDHAEDWPELHARIRGYGTGLSAMLLRHLLRHPGDLPRLLRAVPGRLRHVLHRPQRVRPSGDENAGRATTSGAPVAPVHAGNLLADQVAGLLAGPFALALSAFRAGRARYRAGAPNGRGRWTR